MTARQEILEYIDAFWDAAYTPARKSAWGSVRNLFMHIGRITLPYPMISPNNEYFAGTQYYWDTYFTVIGLLESGRVEAAKRMVDNICFLYDKFGFVPARNAYTSIGRTQPPFLTRMAWEVYTYTKEDDWFDRVMKVAEDEYVRTWNNTRRLDTKTGLSRYRPWVLRKLLTTYESGWDVSSRFAHGQMQLIPVDLNCLLYRYEKDIEAWCRLRKRAKEAITWKRRAEQRRDNIMTYCWDQRRGFFFDYNSNRSAMEELWTLAGFFPLWAGLATKEQAIRCSMNLDRFLQKYGVATSEVLPLQRRQWDYPNNWPPLQLILIEGLQKYGLEKQAHRLSKQWIWLVEQTFLKTGYIWEKYNVVDGGVGARGRYPTQAGFAWTNGVYLRLLRSTQKKTKNKR